MFPVGSRLAFDPARGRLWVVCRGCARWNLSPLEERWEAIEAAERRFRDSRLRVSTDNVGLARLREGVDLIRIGDPQRPEMAAWRYGDQFGRRRSRNMLLTGAAIGTVVAASGGLLAAGIGTSLVIQPLVNSNLRQALLHGPQKTSIGRINLPDGSLVDVQRKHARMSAIERSEDVDTLMLRLEHVGGRTVLLGDDALRVAARLMPTVNRYGGSKRDVQDAVGLLEEIGDPMRVVRSIQRARGTPPGLNLWKRKRTGFWDSKGHEQIEANIGALHTLPIRDRLALEMALHDESERHAMDGELASLERAWREAEEIAQIADTMFVLPSTEAKLAAMRAGR